MLQASLSLIRANLAKLPIRNRIRKHTRVQQAEKIPLCTCLGLKIPENASLGVLLVDLQLRLDEAPRIVFEDLAPGVDEVYIGAGADVGGAGVGAVVAGADLVAVEGSGAVGHGGGPLADDSPVGLGGVGLCVVADKLAMLLEGWRLVQGGDGVGKPIGSREWS